MRRLLPAPKWPGGDAFVTSGTFSPGQGPVCEDARMLYRRLVFGFLLAAWRMWRRMPPKQRQQVVGAVRRHGSRVASSIVQRARARAVRP